MAKMLNESDIESLKKTLFLDATLVEPTYQLFRLTSQEEGRFYWRVEGDNLFTFYASATTVEKATSPTSPYLVQWVGNLGNEEATRQRDAASEYGTALHAAITQFNISGEFHLGLIELWIMQHSEIERPLHPTDGWARTLKRDLLAWMQFVHDYNVRPLAIEVILCSDSLFFAGALDLVCELDVEESGHFGECYQSGPRKGQPKETKRTRRAMAIIDLKSGRKGFYEAHKRQLRAYKLLWEENYPNLPIERLYNWSPKDWRTEPGYNFTDQTEGVTDRQIRLMAALFWERHGEMSNRREVFTEQVLILGGTANGILKYVSLEEYFTEWRTRENIPPTIDPSSNYEL